MAISKPILDETALNRHERLIFMLQMADIRQTLDQLKEDNYFLRIRITSLERRVDNQCFVMNILIIFNLLFSFFVFMCVYIV